MNWNGERDKVARSCIENEEGVAESFFNLVEEDPNRRVREVCGFGRFSEGGGEAGMTTDCTRENECVDPW